MGVDVTTYLMYGIKLDQEKFYEDLGKNNPGIEDDFEYLEAENDGHEDAEFWIVEDGMCGKYLVLGKVIESLSEHEDKFYTISVDKLPDPDTLIEAINKKLNSSYSKSDFKLFFFNHFF